MEPYFNWFLLLVARVHPTGRFAAINNAADSDRAGAGVYLPVRPAKIRSSDCP